MSNRWHTLTRGRRTWLAIGTAFAVVTAIAVPLAVRDAPATAPDPSEMRQHAQAVMPFDLSKTTHTFTKTPTGGVEQVLANDPGDEANIAAIRGHLGEEASKFRNGDYSDPARIHGAEMPGLDQLEAGAPRVTVSYEPLPAGAKITYSSVDPSLVTALHAWFDVQSSDHDMPGMGG